MGALQISKLDQLMLSPSGVAIGNDEMTFAPSHGQFRSERGSENAGSVDDDARVDQRPIGKPQAAPRDFYGSTAVQAGPEAHRLLNKVCCRQRRIQDRIPMNQQSPGQSSSQVGLGLLECMAIDDLRINASGRVKVFFL